MTASLTAGPADGELVVLLHGFPEPPSSWAAVVGLLAETGYRVVAPAQRGYDPDDRPTERAAYRTDALVGDVLALADDLGAHRFHVVGHDWGGVLAWVLGADHPQRLRTLTSVATPHPAALLWSMWRSTQPLRSLYVPFFWLPGVSERLLLAGGGRILRRALERSGLEPDPAAEYVEAMREPGALTAALNWYRAASLGQLRRLDRISVPTLYVWGDADTTLGRAAAEATARWVEAPYRFEVLAGASHWIPEQHPEQLVERLLPLLSGR